LRDPELVMGVVGASGRLGGAIVAECVRRGIRVGTTASRAGWNIAAAAGVLVDASAPGALDRTVGHCAESGAALIYAVSSISPESLDRLRELSTLVHVVIADNLSVGHWLQRTMVRHVAALAGVLDSPPRMSVLERHPVTKRDRPSASAKSLAAAWAESAPSSCQGEIGSLRAGHPVSDHTVIIDLPGESVVIEHGVTDLGAAAAGALTAARRIAGLPPGMSTMEQIYSGHVAARAGQGRGGE
jgi:4-hydroxy-tetrahydrodipicolinate reductase